MPLQLRKVMGGQSQLNGCDGNIASKSDNGCQMSLTQQALAILFNPPCY